MSRQQIRKEKVLHLGSCKLFSQVIESSFSPRKGENFLMTRVLSSGRIFHMRFLPISVCRNISLQ